MYNNELIITINILINRINFFFLKNIYSVFQKSEFEK